MSVSMRKDTKKKKKNSLTTSFFLFTRQMMETLSKKEFETWTMVARSLWHARNKIHFRKSQPHPTEILKQEKI